ncbi:hypothetical protein CEXT_724001 [Caerostris extrusa]|uniref:Uncharacterized protein n=1 Tax=Caerostris extrusa TaxID=172846 RepID=A0AAV4XCI8_CAEEX|nr:hypothetical protein CEXT_724001 [Caerostris extrusa]
MSMNPGKQKQVALLVNAQLSTHVKGHRSLFPKPLNPTDPKGTEIDFPFKNKSSASLWLQLMRKGLASGRPILRVAFSRLSYSFRSKEDFRFLISFSL